MEKFAIKDEEWTKPFLEENMISSCVVCVINIEKLTSISHYIRKTYFLIMIYLFVYLDALGIRI